MTRENRAKLNFLPEHFSWVGWSNVPLEEEEQAVGQRRNAAAGMSGLSSV